MSAPLWVRELAGGFWDLVPGGPGPFPRSLAGPIARTGLEVTVRESAGLDVAGVARYLAGIGVGWKLDVADRPLRACLVACNGAGFVFLDAADPDDERRFSLAHELAHFLRHYREPRRRAVERIGPRVLEVLDGLRPPTPAEQLHGLLRRAPAGPHVHLMERGERGAVPAEIAAAESEADRLAFELLAPADIVLADEPADSTLLTARLVGGFGLPEGAARAYAGLLRPGTREGGLLGRLKLFSGFPSHSGE